VPTFLWKAGNNWPIPMTPQTEVFQELLLNRPTRWTLLGMFVTKYFAPQVPLVGHAFVLFWASLRVFLVALVLTLLDVAYDVPAETLNGVLGLLGMFAIGWLVTRDLGKRYGTPTRFSAIGAKVMLSMMVVTWGIFSIAYVVLPLWRGA
jgi:hypothetical protein